MATGRKIALIVEYDGTNYRGSQLQVGLPTIQGIMEKALCQLTGEEARVKMAGRTDAGVHARGQVACFRTGSALPVETFVKGLNYHLPEDVAVREAQPVDETFDARRDAVSREYRYYIWNSPTRSPINRRFSYQVAGRLDLEAMNEAGQALIGEHDFASFSTSAGAAGKNTTRQVYKAEIERQGEMVVLDMVASSFLPRQVRSTVGALIRVGQGKMTVARFKDILEAQSPGLAGPTAPARGLFLEKVNYPVPLGRN